ncbi:FidL [Pectobacterium sp. B1J-3]|uniref:FidL n=1 Tax=Pectobacterium sp. B1J-3 TaxID=3385371 RepID=UPI003905B4F6
MLTIKIGKKTVFIAVASFISLFFGVFFYFNSNLYNKPLICHAEVKVNENDKTIRKEYDIYFYLNSKNRALVLVNGIYIDSSGIPLTIRRTFSFDATRESNRLVVHNITLDKNVNDSAPENAIPILGENDVIQIEMLTKHTYLVSTVQSKMACNIRY